MGTALIVFKQTVIMFLLMLVGAWLFKTGKVTKEGSRDMANMLVNIILPCSIFSAFCTPYTPEKTERLVWAFLIGFLCITLSIIVSRIIFRGESKSLDHFGTAFSNAGFMGIPLIVSIYGREAVIYAAPFIALLNILQWTYGVEVLTGDKSDVSPKRIFLNQFIISFALGILVYFLKIPMPTVIMSTVNFIASMNAPIAMIIMGVYLAQTDIKSLFTTPHLYWNAAVRLLIIPAITIALLMLLPERLLAAKLATLVSASAPVGANAAVYAQLHNKDYSYACETVCLSTLLSIITMPLITAAAHILWQ